MKIVSALAAIGFIIMACWSVYRLNIQSARYCVQMAMMWCIYLKLLNMEEKHD